MADNPEPKSPRILAIIDPEHPEAGKGGVVPPVETRFKDGPDERRSSTGRPRGCSPTAAILRRLARDQDTDGIGREAAQVADEFVNAARSGDVNKAGTLRQLIERVDGKAKEFHEMSGTQGRTIQTVAPDPTRVVPPLPDLPEEE